VPTWGAEGTDLASVSPPPQGGLVHTQHARGVAQTEPGSPLRGLDSARSGG
jgi:hypothetical protein